ncbi:MAG: VanZ family protein [Actinomycetia bacterium]|nr:VanZ family protein [Actinomycetes bacterium]
MRIVVEFLPAGALLSLVVAVLVTIAYAFINRPKMRKLVVFLIVTFLSAFYVIVACHVLFDITKQGIYAGTSPYYGNYTPLKTIMLFARNIHSTLFLTQIAGNILITMPLPFVLWFYSQRRLMGRVCLVSLMITAAIEPLQLLINIYLGGPANIIDVDDLILNLTGCLLGLLLLAIVNGIRKPKRHHGRHGRG